MKHASLKTLDCIEDILTRLRKYKSLKEKQKGIFYKGSQAFIHFHEDLKGVFADLKVKNEWERFLVSTKPGKERFLKNVHKMIQKK